MANAKTLSILLIFCLLVSLIFPIAKVYAESGNEVTLNFEGGIIHDGYVEYSEIGKLQLFKGDELVINISNDMKIDLDEADYQFVIDDSSSEDTTPTRIIINDWYYSLDEIDSQKIFKLDSSKFYAGLNIKLEKKYSAVNNKKKVEMAKYEVTETIDLSKEYIIDFSKTDDLTHVLKLFADLDKTIYYKLADDNDLEETTNVDEAIIKVVGNKNENSAVITAVNVGNKKEEKIKGLRVKYHNATVESVNDKGILNIIEHLHYSTNLYEFTFKYVKDEVEAKEYKVVEGANQIYTIDESKNATFRIDADYSLFTNKVYVDNKLVDSTNYDSKSGSTIITLKDEYLKTLSVGEHTLKVAFLDDGEAITKFTIKEKQQNTNIDVNENTKNEENQENDVKKDNKIANPKTGDNVIVYAVLFVIALIGIIILIIVNNTKRKKLRKH
jgi:hypothetical protein